jgi:predicted GNAT superfamily acetyltransferase
VIVAWDLTRPPDLVERTSHPGLLVNPPAADGLPSLNGLLDASVVRIAIPRDLDTEAGDRLAVWRQVTRAAFESYLGRGYEVVGFRRGQGDELPSYELSPSELRSAAAVPTGVVHAAH